jgi:hypothetical protein
VSRNLLTLEQAKRHLNIDVYADAESSSSDTDPEAGIHDAEILEKIEEASEVILKHLKSADFLDSDGFVPVDSEDRPEIPGNVRAAAKLMLGYLWEHRDEDAEGAYQDANLPQGVRALLAADRVPTLA